MTCTNCGAAMQLAASRRHFTCHHCGSSRFAAPLDADGFQLLGAAPTPSPCPACASGLSHALFHDEPVDLCQECRGVLLPRETFAELVHRLRRWAATPPRVPPPLDRAALDRKRSCPRCSGALDTYPYGGAGNAVIDGCARCDVIWLDYGELQQIVDAPGRDRGSA